MLRRLAIGLALVVCIHSRSFADTVTITTDTVISDSDMSLENQDVVVHGAVLTINGRHTLNSLVVERNESNQPGVVTHSAGFSNRSLNGLELDVAGDVVIQGAADPLVASRIDVSSRGFAQGQGPGAGAAPDGYGSGGGHGGNGGASANGNFPGGAPYDSFTNPVQFGSGGALGNSGGTAGAGGGALRLSVTGTLTVDGSIMADGATSTYYYNGAGAGGSIWITCGTLAGAGIITANGGPAYSNQYASGGGGRIAIYANASSFNDLNIRTYSGLANDSYCAAAGTVYLRPASNAAETLIIDNGNQTSPTLTTMTGSVTIPQNLLVRNSGRLGPAAGDASLHITVQGDASIASNGVITADRRGYGVGQGPGAGSAPDGTGSGGGHGGGGGKSANNDAPGGATYGSFTAPITMGSGGALGTSGGTAGMGGGVIRLSVAGQLTVDGAISADGGAPTYYYNGGGSGGSIWIDCGTLAGAGLIHANGGDAFSNQYASGGGGRVAVYANSSSFSDANIRAYGGVANGGYVTGAAGTVYTKLTAASPETLIIDAGLRPSLNNTEIVGDFTVPQNLLVRNGGRIGPAVGDTTMHLIVLGDAAIDANATIGAEGRGYATGQGPGAGIVGDGNGSGGGHGGRGGNSANNLAIGGGTYGSFINPNTMGSGGALGNSGGFAGTGGGVIRVSVAGTFTVNGSINADGMPATYYYNGGGAGGSIWIDCGTLNGAGSIHANGGNAFNTQYASGGGGRVAVFANASNFSDSNISAHGGAAGGGAYPGAAGTVFLKPTAASPETLIIDNGGLASATVTEVAGDVEVPENLLVRNNGRLGPADGDTSMHLTVDGDAVIAANGFVYADAKGFGVGAGPGAGSVANGHGSGGGHGGAGGASANNDAPGGATYGSANSPNTMGSGGALGTSGGNAGVGGGVIRMSVIGTLTVDGTITANGTAATYFFNGSGAGGSIWIDCGTITGNGMITARGGDGYNTQYASGGGGRIAIQSCNVLFDPAHINIAAGSATSTPGQDGTLHLLAKTIDVQEQPQDQTIPQNGTAMFSVVAAGTNLGYQWRRNGEPLTDDDHISGALTPNLTITGATCLEHAGQIDVVINDPCGFAFSEPATLVVQRPADINHDCFVNVNDLLGVINSWGACPSQCTVPCPADVAPAGGDCVVNVADLLAVINNWGS